MDTTLKFQTRNTQRIYKLKHNYYEFIGQNSASKILRSSQILENLPLHIQYQVWSDGKGRQSSEPFVI